MSRIVRIAAFALGLLGAVTASQGPEFAQQYRQRLGGSIDELHRIVARFDADAAANGETRERAIGRLRGNPDDLYELWCVRDDGTKISAGTFRVNARGQAAVDLTTAAVPGEYHRMSVERKPGERVMVGEIEYGSS